MALKIRRGTDAERAVVTFAEGELVYTTDTDELYIGDGSTVGGVLLAGSALSSIGSMLVADTINSELDLQENLNLNGNNIIGSGNINITGDIHASGNITAGGNIDIGDNSNDTLTIVAQVDSNITPTSDTSYDLGGISARWRNGYFTGLTVDGQIDAVAVNSDIVADNSTVMVDVSTNTFTGNLTGNVTGDLSGNVTGNVTGNTTGYHLGDVKGSVFGDGSEVLVDAVNGRITAPVVGDVTGNITGNVKAPNGFTVLNAGTDGTDASIVADLLGNVTGNVTGDLSGNVTGNVTGNTTGYHLGDVKGSVFGDDSTPIIDAVSNTINGNLTGSVTGNIFTNLIDSADSSEIIVTPTLRTQSDIIVEQSLFVGAGGVVFRNDGSANIATLEVAIITDSGFGSISVDTSLELTGGIVAPGFSRFLDTVNMTWANDTDGKSLIIQKFTGDVENELETDDPANYTLYAEITDSRAAFGVPVKFPVVADDTARSALVPTPEKGMVILMESGTTPSATNQLQFYDGSNWVNV